MIWILCLFIFATPWSHAAEWLDADADDVETVLCVGDNQFSWYSGPGGQEEWLLNFGASQRTRLKGYQDITGLKFDLTLYRGRTILDAELRLARADTTPVFALAASTINADWNEGSTGGGEAKAGGSLLALEEAAHGYEQSKSGR